MKKLHLPLIASILAGLFCTGLKGQTPEPGKIREIYLSGNFLTFNNFGAQYKAETKKGNFFRIGLTSFNSTFNKTNIGSPSAYDNKTTDIGGGFEIGFEKRKQITEKLTAFYGINLTASSNFQRYKSENPSLPMDLRHTDHFSIFPGLSFNSGMILKITGDFSIAAEIIPRLLFTYSSNENINGSAKVKDIITGGSFGFNNQSLSVSLIYKWNKK
jgi:hypothetical protein